MDITSKLYESSHKLLHLGEDGSPIYANEFSDLNVEVLKLSDELFPIKGKTIEEEARICIALLMGYNATIYHSGDKEAKKQAVLDRSWRILDALSSSLLKCQLLTYCYGEVFDEELAEKAREIIHSWQGHPLSIEEKEIIEYLKSLEENQYPWDDVEE